MDEIVVGLLILALVLVSLAPFLRISHGAIRSCAFPRLQILGLALIVAAITPFVLRDGWLWAGLGALAGIITLQAANISRFTPLWRPQSVQAADDLAGAADRRTTLLASNVKQSNRDYDRLIALVREREPDLFMAMETDADWVEALGALRPLFEYHVERPQDNGYGMVLYSRLPLEEPEVRDLLVEEVPSIRTGVRLPSGELFRLYVVHPEPPVPYQDSDGRDAEIGLVGLEAKDDALPAIVAGDLNDVAWSHTTRRFQRLSGLLDPRVGRGFYNTFHADWPIFRWPLDHLFHDPRFRLVEMERLGHVGSDHFPMFFTLALAHAPDPNGQAEESCPEEKEEVLEMASNERKRNREAIGSHWEDE